jgi:hypothetical protein
MVNVVFWKMIVALCENIVTKTILPVSGIESFEMLNHTEHIAKSVFKELKIPRKSLLP